MRRLLLAALLVAAFAVPLAWSGNHFNASAQTSVPQSDEFNGGVFTAPWKEACGGAARTPCPDSAGPATWSLTDNPGFLRIWSQYGDLRGTSTQGSNNARNMFLQPFNPGFDFTATTSLTFPAVSQTVTPLGQAAGMIVYQDDDDWIAVYRTYASGVSQLQFTQESAGVDTTATLVEALPSQPIFLQLNKTGSTYSAAVSASPNGPWTSFVPASYTPTPVGTGTATPVPPVAGYTASYATPQIGLFAWGGLQPALVNNPALAIPADFDWFRVGNPLTPGPTAAPTSTGTAVATATGTAAPTSTAGPTSTATTVPTNTPAPTNTPIPAPPTPTPRPSPSPSGSVSFKSLSLWYHLVRIGTFDHVDIQARQHRVLGVWAHVLFPSGVHYDYYTNTDSGGHWAQTFPVPRDAIGPHGSNAIVAVQLWRGKHTVKNFIIFTVVK